MKQIELPMSMNLDECINMLYTYKEPVCAEFNSSIITNTISKDENYKRVTGMTEKEFKEKQDKYIKDLLNKMQQHEENAINKIPYWIEEGHKVFSKDKWKDWDEVVPIRAKDLYNGFELDCTLKIQDYLKNKEFELAQYRLNRQGHSAMSYSLMKAMIREFCDNGEEFLEYLKRNRG